jgi:hypothetical protein
MNDKKEAEVFARKDSGNASELNPEGLLTYPQMAGPVDVGII